MIAPLLECTHANRSIIQQKLFEFFLPQEAGAFENNIKKKPQKATPKIEKIYISNIYIEYMLCLPVVVFCENVLIL